MPGALGEGQVVLAKDVVFVDIRARWRAPRSNNYGVRSRAIDTLKDGDRFEIVRFSTEAEPFFHERSSPRTPAIASALVRSSPVSTQRVAPRSARHWRGGSPRRAGATRVALVVVLVTDGLPTVGEMDAGTRRLRHRQRERRRRPGLLVQVSDDVDRASSTA
ncbi:MAG: hypothetical protein U0610_30130 [bacterium]